MPKGVYKRKPFSEERKERLSKILKGRHLSPKSEFKKGEHANIETEFKKGKSGNIGHQFKKGEYQGNGKKTQFGKGKNHPNWQDGKSFEPYGIEFNEDLKEVIRNRERRKCFICEKTELENKFKLIVHHINYDKRNNNPKNLISLCISCHAKTNFNREYWIKYFNCNLILDHLRLEEE